MGSEISKPLVYILADGFGNFQTLSIVEDIPAQLQDIVTLTVIQYFKFHS